jgi:hypothetical protein
MLTGLMGWVSVKYYSYSTFSFGEDLFKIYVTYLVVGKLTKINGHGTESYEIRVHILVLLEYFPDINRA